MITAERIKERRTRLGISATDLAEMIGKNRATVYRYESNEIEALPASVIEPLARALITTPAYLLGWTDDPSPATYRDSKTKADRQGDIGMMFAQLNEKNKERLIDYAQMLIKVQNTSESNDCMCGKNAKT